MYQLIVKRLREKRPDLKTVAVAWEPDFAHSSSTWKLIIKPTIEKEKYHQIVEVVEWGWQDTEFGTPVGKLAKANADIYFTLTHEPTTCASFAEMARQGVKPRAVVAISSLAGGTVIVGCPIWRRNDCAHQFRARDPQSHRAREEGMEPVPSGKQSRSQPYGV